MHIDVFSIYMLSSMKGRLTDYLRAVPYGGPAIVRKQRATRYQRNVFNLWSDRQHSKGKAALSAHVSQYWLVYIMALSC